MELMNLEEDSGAMECYSGEEDSIPYEEEILEPNEGMEFESEEAAKEFYYEYAKQTGFLVRVLQCRRSDADGSVIARGFGCNKEGYCPKKRRKTGSPGKPTQSMREGCKAMIIVRLNKSGKWVVRKFVKDHNHPLVISPPEVSQTMDLKDRKIRELTAELRSKRRLCALYQDQLTAFMKEVEDHSNQLTKRVQTVVDNLKEFDPIEREL